MTLSSRKNWLTLKTFQVHFGVSRFTLEWLHCLCWKITVSTENKIPPIISFMYNQCTLKINWCTLKINQSINWPPHLSVYTAYGYQCPLKMNFNQLPAWCMIGRKKISVSVHTDSQKLVYTENKLVSTENNQCTPVFENWCVCSHWFSKTGVHWKQTGVHWKLTTSQWNQGTSVFENQCICSHWFSKTGVHWKHTGVHWKLTSQWNQCTLLSYQYTPVSTEN